MEKVSKVYRHLERYRQILRVLVKYGLSEMVSRAHLIRYLGKKGVYAGEKKRIEELGRVERVRIALEELGPTFIKLGQILSLRPDLVSLELAMELRKLQDNVPAFSFAEAKREVEEELKAPLGRNFSFFDTKPLAAGSIAQTHLAKLLNGEEVIVKVRRPRIKQIIETDLEIMFHLANLMEKYRSESKLYNPVKIVKEFSKIIRKELDFTYEANNIKKFAYNFINDATVYTPRVVDDLCEERVLTMERIKGIKISNYKELETAGLDRKIIARNGANSILKQVFDYGFFHGDPHPGNIYVLRNNVICFLDFGMMGRLDKQTRENLADLFIAIIRKDANAVIKAFTSMSDENGYLSNKELKEDIEEFIDRYYGLSLRQIKFSKVFTELVNITIEHKLKIPASLCLLEKALVTVDGLGRDLDPDFNMVSLARPFAEKLIMRRMSPFLLAGDILKSSRELYQLLKEIPAETREVLQKIKNGKLKIEFEHKGLNPMLSSSYKISNKISLSIIVSALIIGSSLIVLSKTKPFLWGFPAIGVIGFLVAGVFGLYIIISILRSGKL